MNIRTIPQTICSIVAAGFLALTAAGCQGINAKYAYDWKMGEDQVRFNQARLMNWWVTTLTVTRPDGRVIKYYDEDDNDLKLEYIKITKDPTGDKRTTRYTAEDAPRILQLGQAQFDKYLADILKAKEEEGLRDLQ